MKSRKKSTFHPAGKVAFLIICALLAFRIISLQLQITDLRTQSKELDSEISRKEMANKELTQSLEEGNTDESIAKIARDVLGYASPGERVYIDSAEQ